MSSFKNIITILLGVFFGLFNYIIYNIYSGFPTLKPFFLKIFSRTEYNKTPIDYKQAKPLIDELSIKFKILFSFFGEYYYLYIVITLAIIIIFIVSLYKIFKLKEAKEHKLYFFPLLVFLLIMVFILISPNTTRAGHYVYLIPFYELTILSALVLMYRLFGVYKPVRFIVFAIPILILGMNLVVSNAKVSEANKTNGTGYFSPAIYDLKSYIDENGIDYNDIVHIQWGLYSQLYFLNKGQVKINSIVFDLLNATTEKERFQVFRTFFLSPENKMKDSLYFPIYTNYYKNISESFYKLVASNGGKLRKVNAFYEKSGAEVFSLFKLENFKELLGNLNNGETSK